ncbi:hypothetical protein [Dehalobacter sp. MCB1]|uniref:hypothetical protein n=1 Tax=Dehalobacter sp. MCB1 TaxID=1844756 RepID=UPI00105317EB|nr:hypothetical protein [Dehalobacter sp. MCB1]
MATGRLAFPPKGGDNNGKILSDLNPGITTVESKVFEISKELYNSGKWFVLIDNSKKVAIN